MQKNTMKSQHLVKPICYLTVGLLAVGVFDGCSLSRPFQGEDKTRSKPTVGVHAFSSRIPGEQFGHLGLDLAEQLTEELVLADRYMVLDPLRTQLLVDQVDLFFSRPDNKTVQPVTYPVKMRYLVKGKVTDYGFIPLNWKDRVTKLKIIGRGYAIVAATLTVVDTHTKHTVAILRVSGKVDCNQKTLEKAEEQNAKGFASNAFFYTTMGKATRKFLKKAVKEINGAIKNPIWQPKIASIINGQVIINGGRDYDVQVSQVYEVRPPAEIVLDPDSYSSLGYVSGKPLGKVRVTQVLANYAVAAIVTSNERFQSDQTLFPIEFDSPYNLTQRAIKSNY